MKHTPRIHTPVIPNLYRLSQIHHWREALLALDQFQGLTPWQVGRLLFHNELSQKREPRNPDAARQAASSLCLRRLKRNGYVAVADYQLRNPVNRKWERQEAYALTPDGRIILENNLPGYRPVTDWGTPETVGSFRQHDHLVNEIGVAIAAAAKWEGYAYDWKSSPALRSDPGLKRYGVIPDGFLMLSKEGKNWPFFIEYDNNTENLRGCDRSDLEQKLRKYIDYLTNGWADSTTLDGTEGVRLLFIVKNPTRLQSLVDLAESLGCKSRYWFAPLDFFLLEKDPDGDQWFDAKPLESIWKKCGTKGYRTLL